MSESQVSKTDVLKALERLVEATGKGRNSEELVSPSEKYFSVGRIHREVWGDSRRTATSYIAEFLLDTLYEEGRLERVIVSLGESTDNLKVYRLK